MLSPSVVSRLLAGARSGNGATGSAVPAGRAPFSSTTKPCPATVRPETTVEPLDTPLTASLRVSSSVTTESISISPSSDTSVTFETAVETTTSLT
jgi:hypothetical protein